MNAKPFLVLLMFVSFLAIFASGAIGSADLTPGGGSGMAVPVTSYDAFTGQPNTLVAGVQTSRCGPTYSIAAGDTLTRISQSCGVTLRDLLAQNPNITNPNMIHPGQVLRIYIAATPAPQIPTASPTPAGLRPGGAVHVEVKGFWADAKVQVEIGKVGGDPILVNEGQTDANGVYRASIPIPVDAKAKEKWIVTIVSAADPKIKVSSASFEIEG
jgi:LysM repeat protein